MVGFVWEELWNFYQNYEKRLMGKNLQFWPIFNWYKSSKLVLFSQEEKFNLSKMKFGQNSQLLKLYPVLELNKLYCIHSSVNLIKAEFLHQQLNNSVLYESATESRVSQLQIFNISPPLHFTTVSAYFKSHGGKWAKPKQHINFCTQTPIISAHYWNWWNPRTVSSFTKLNWLECKNNQGGYKIPLPFTSRFSSACQLGFNFHKLRCWL